MTTSSGKNLGPGPRRQRFYAGISSLLIAIVATVALPYMDLHPLWNLILFFPFWMAALGFLQYTNGT